MIAFVDKGCSNIFLAGGLQTEYVVELEDRIARAF